MERARLNAKKRITLEADRLSLMVLVQSVRFLWFLTSFHSSNPFGHSSFFLVSLRVSETKWNRDRGIRGTNGSNSKTSE